MPKILLTANTDWYLYNFRLSLARYLRERGNEVVLVSPSGRFAAKSEEAGFRWLQWDLGRKSMAPWKELSSIIDLVRIFQREKPDLVHNHTIKPVLYGSIAARITRVPACINSVTGRGYVFLADEPRARLLGKLVKPFYRFALGYQRCGVIFENGGDRQFFIDEQLVNSERAWLVEGVGVDPEIFTPHPEPPGPLRIVMASRMLWDKGVGVLVEAARLLKDTPAHVILVGEPDPGNPKSVPPEVLKGWHDEGVVEWWGWRDDMAEVYQSCHIVALPSFYEGVPTALLEAAACARPIVATDIPGCRSVVHDGENGFLVQTGDAKALADALKKLVDDQELREQMGASGRRIVLKNLTSDQVNKQTMEVYSAVYHGRDGMQAGCFPYGEKQ